MQPASVITLVFLLLLSVAHLFRLVFRVEIVAAEYVVPVWFSAFACLGPAALAYFLWRELRGQRDPA